MVGESESWLISFFSFGELKYVVKVMCVEFVKDCNNFEVMFLYFVRFK